MGQHDHLHEAGTEAGAEPPSAGSLFDELRRATRDFLRGLQGADPQRQALNLSLAPLGIRQELKLYGMVRAESLLTGEVDVLTPLGRAVAAALPPLSDEEA